VNGEVHRAVAELVEVVMGPKDDQSGPSMWRHLEGEEEGGRLISGGSSRQRSWMRSSTRRRGCAALGCDSVAHQRWHPMLQSGSKWRSRGDGHDGRRQNC
jgi:hypothetical protein